MHKLIYHTSALFGVAAVLLLLPANLSAQTVYQHQSSSSNIEMKCEGTCKVTSESTQSQTQRVGESNWHQPERKWRQPHHKTWQSQHHPNGHATVTWSPGEGTCTIRYTENNSRWYKYTTSANCTDGHVTIGGLVPGRTYRFQVKSDGSYWQAPQHLTAW